MKPNGISTLKAENLGAQRGILHAFFTREGGVSDGIYDSLNVGLGSDDKTENVHENRKRAMAAINRPAEALHTMYQVHGADVVQVNSDAWDTAQAPKADALVTNCPGVVLGVLTADCVPVLFSDPSEDTRFKVTLSSWFIKLSAFHPISIHLFPALLIKFSYNITNNLPR